MGFVFFKHASLVVFSSLSSLLAYSSPLSAGGEDGEEGTTEVEVSLSRG